MPRKLIKCLLLLLVVLQCVSVSWAFEKVTILEISRTGRTILVDRGHLEGVKLGDVARFIIQGGTVDTPDLSNVALGEVVKISSNSSYWYLYDVAEGKTVDKGKSVLMAKADDVMLGRRRFRTLRKSISSGKRPVVDVKKHERGRGETIPEELVFKKGKFDESEKMHDTRVDYETDLEVLDFEDLMLGGDDVYVEDLDEDLGFYNVPQGKQKVSSDKIRKREDVKVLNSTVDGNIAKTNNLEKGLGTLYNESKRDPELPETQDKGVIRSTYEQYRDEKREEIEIHPRDYKKVEQAGVFWSADMSDRQLRRFFVKSGLGDEYERRRLALENKEGHEFLVRYHYGTLNNSIETIENFQAPHKELYLAYEWHLMKTAPSLTRFTIEVGYYSGIGNYGFGTTNAKSEESGFKAMFNYYFFNFPSAVKRFAWYVGTGVGIGSATITSPDISREYEYKTMRLNYGQLGVKYRLRGGDEFDKFFNVGIGLNFVMSLESTILRSNQELADNIDGTIQVNDLKFGIGATVFF